MLLDEMRRNQSSTRNTYELARKEKDESLDESHSVPP